MSDSARIVVCAIIAFTFVCLLALTFMFAADRTSDGRRFRSFTASFVRGLLLLTCAGIVSGIALEADRRHAVFGLANRSGWMIPEQGYAAAILLFLAGIYAIILAVRDTGRRDP